MPKKTRNSVRSFALLATATALTTLGAGLTSPARAAAVTSPAANRPAATSSAGSSSAGVGLAASGLAAAVPARTSSAALSPRVGPPPDHKLKAALLSTADLPAGYQSMGDPEIIDLEMDTNVDFCDDLRGNAAPANVIKVRSAVATFMRLPEGPALVETLSVTGAREARAVVAGVAAAPDRCPTIKQDGALITIKPVPLPGSIARAAGIRLEFHDPASKSDLRGSVIVIAHRDLLLVLSIASGSADDRRALEKVAAVAGRKLTAAVQPAG
jgi:hypothetical protein